MASEGSVDVQGSLKALNKLQNDGAEKFVHKAINDACEKDGLHYDDYAKVLSLAEYSQLKRTLSDLIRPLCRDGIKKEEVAEKLVGMGVDGELSQLVAGCLWVRREEVRSQLLRDSYKFSHTYLNDFDWRLKLIMSSDKLGSIQQPVVSMDFDLCEGGESRRENVELSKDELEKLISSLEAANKVVTQLRT